MYIMDKNNARSSGFYSVMLKNFATPWTNRDQTVFAPLNDYTATVIGMVRDDKDFRGILSDDIVYVGNGVTPAYATTSNAHYDALEGNNADLRTVLVERTQSSLNGLPATATAGVITSRAAAEAFFIDGTNRAMFRFTLLNHLCRDMEQVHDTSRPPDRIRQDVTRSPGGDSSDLPQQLRRLPQRHGSDGAGVRVLRLRRNAGPPGLHAGAGAAEVPDQLGQLQARLRHAGRSLGQPLAPARTQHADRLVGPGHRCRGTGAKSLGQELANSDAFAQCQVEKVFRTVCFRSPSDQADRDQIGNTILPSFRNSGYQPEDRVRRNRRVLRRSIRRASHEAQIRTSVLRLAALAAVSMLALAGCGGGAEHHAESRDQRSDRRPELQRSRAGHRRHPGVPRQLLGKRARHQSLRQLPQRRRPDAELRALGRRQCGLSAGIQPSSIATVRRSRPWFSKVAGGHNCWLADSSACASILTRWITDWVGATGTGGKQIELVEPTAEGSRLEQALPGDAACSVCRCAQPAHAVLRRLSPLRRGDRAVAVLRGDATSSSRTTRRSSKINLDDPANSRFVIRLGRESHNCWSNCATNASTMQAAIQAMADTIPVTQVNPALVVSKALTLYDGTVASGGNRYDTNVIALYEFKSGEGAIAYDTSGVDPAADLTLNGTRVTDYDWVGGWGVMFKTPMAKAQASTASSRKFQQLIARDRRVLDRSLGDPRQCDAGRRAHRQLLRQHDGPQLHDGPDAVQLRLPESQHRDRFERHARTVDARCRRASAGIAAARGHDVRSGQRPPHLCERRVHRRHRCAGRRHARRMGQQLRLRAG